MNFKGSVVDAGGGHVDIIVDRDTAYYPDFGAYVYVSDVDEIAELRRDIQIRSNDAERDQGAYAEVSNTNAMLKIEITELRQWMSDAYEALHEIRGLYTKRDDIGRIDGTLLGLLRRAENP